MEKRDLKWKMGESWLEAGSMARTLLWSGCRMGRNAWPKCTEA
jgi:hypothetical protein